MSKVKAAGRAVVKVRALGPRAAQASNVKGPDEEALFREVGALTPRYDPRRLCELYEESSALRPNIDAYATNIDGFGHQLQPTIDLDAADAKDRVEDAMILERMFDGELPAITPEEVAARIIEIKAVARLEKVFLDAFLASCCEDMSLVELRQRTTADLETTGNGYWEILREPSGRLSGFAHLPSVTTRLMQREEKWHDVSNPHRISAMAIRRLPRRRRFRMFVQILNGVEEVYFKEFGDPRTYSSKTGRQYGSLEDLAAAECGVPPATEVHHWKIYSPLSSYGVPRWVGATPAVMGTRESELINVAYFKSKCIPPMAVIVENGTLDDGALKRIEDTIENQIKGEANFHAILLIESGSNGMDATTMAPLPPPKITLQPLSHFQQKDALFQVYEQNNAEKVGQQFRLPRLLRGQMSDFNRATAEQARQYAEQQVFQPIRTSRDHDFDRFLIELGIRFWRFTSGAPTERNPIELMTMIASAVHENILVPREARELVKDVFGREFEELEEEWTKGPVAALAKGQSSAAGEAVKAIVELRAALDAREQETYVAANRPALELEAAKEETLTIEMPSDEFRSLFKPGP